MDRDHHTMRKLYFSKTFFLAADDYIVVLSTSGCCCCFWKYHVYVRPTALLSPCHSVSLLSNKSANGIIDRTLLLRGEAKDGRAESVCACDTCYRNGASLCMLGFWRLLLHSFLSLMKKWLKISRCGNVGPTWYLSLNIMNELFIPYPP